MVDWQKVANKNGIKYSTYRSRINQMGWSPEKAATTKTNFLNTRLGKLAKQNGISYHTYWTRINELGWDPEVAATKPIQKRRPDKDWIDFAESNGINRRTYIGRVYKSGWSPQEAATTPPRVRRDTKWIKLAKSNGIGFETYSQRVDELFWYPEKAATTPPMTKDEVVKIAHKYNMEYWKTKQERAFNDEDNLYTLTPEHVAIGVQNGIGERTIEMRIYQLGWTVQEATTKPLQQTFPDKPDGYDKYREIAIANGVNRSTFLGRVKRGWSLENAASSNPVYKHRRKDKKWMDLAVENGINRNTYLARVDLMDWPKEKAATIPALAKGQYLNEDRRERAKEGFKTFINPKRKTLP